MQKDKYKIYILGWYISIRKHFYSNFQLYLAIPIVTVIIIMNNMYMSFIHSIDSASITGFEYTYEFSLLRSLS